jgi:hypothetical protein
MRVSSPWRHEDRYCLESKKDSAPRSDRLMFDPRIASGRVYGCLKMTRSGRGLSCAIHLIEVLTVSPNWQSLMFSCCNCHRRALRSARFLDRGLELMRQCFDDARAETRMWGLAVRIR